MPRQNFSLRIREGVVMANVKKGQLTRPPQWWKHLRDWKRVFWKSERQAGKRQARKQAQEKGQDEIV